MVYISNEKKTLGATYPNKAILYRRMTRLLHTTPWDRLASTTQ